MQYLRAFFLGSLGSLMGGILGILLGAFIGGNFGFPKLFGGLVGYESGGLLFALIGIALGNAAAFKWLIKLQMKSSILGIVTLLIFGILFTLMNVQVSEDLATFQTASLLLLPPLFVLLAFKYGKV